MSANTTSTHKRTNTEIDALRTINKINYYARGSCKLIFFKTSLLGIIEWICYLATALIIYTEFSIASKVNTISQKLENSPFIIPQVKSEELVVFLSMIKVVFFAIAGFTLIIALLLRKIRNKNVALIKVKEKAIDFLEIHRSN